MMTGSDSCTCPAVLGVLFQAIMTVFDPFDPHLFSGKTVCLFHTAAVTFADFECQDPGEPHTLKWLGKSTFGLTFAFIFLEPYLHRLNFIFLNAHLHRLNFVDTLICVTVEWIHRTLNMLSWHALPPSHCQS